MIYLITYNLRGHNIDYTLLYDKIKSLGDNHIQAMDSLWFISSNKPLSVDNIIKTLKDYIDKYDLLFVSELPKSVNKEGKLSKVAWDFIKSNENNINH